MLENDNVFKLSSSLNIYFFSCVGILPIPHCWSISVKDSKVIESFILRCLLIICPNKTGKVLTLKLTADLILAKQHTSHTSSNDIPKMFNRIFKAFSDKLLVSKIVSLKSWLHFGFGIKTKRGLSPTIHIYRHGINIWAAFLSSLIIIIQGKSILLEMEVNSFQLSTIITKTSILNVVRGPSLI